MGKKGQRFQPRPATSQKGVFGYGDLYFKQRRRKLKPSGKARDLARERDAIRQSMDEDNRVNFDAVKQLLRRNPHMPLEEAKRLSRNI